jgi:enoyl-CoA hydratase
VPYTTIKVTTNGPVGLITLARPGAGNTITSLMAQEMAEAFQSMADDDGILAVVLTGDGTSFSLGADPAEPPPHSLEELEAFLASHQASERAANLEKPIIAAVNGPCLGQGLELALACDLRVASQTATFAMPQLAHEGRIPWDGGTQRLPRVVGRAAALDLLLTGRTIDAQEALRLGLVNRVVEPTGLLEHATKLAQQIAEYAPISVRYVKEAVHKGLDVTLEQGLRLEGDLYFILQTTEDRDEGIRSFLEKRKPQFKGK